MKQYEFTVKIHGYGENAEEAWLKACSELGLESSPVPENPVMIVNRGP